MMFRAYLVGSNLELRKEMRLKASAVDPEAHVEKIAFGDTMISFKNIDKEEFFSFLKKIRENSGVVIRKYAYVDGKSWWDAKMEHFLGTFVWNSEFDLDERLLNSGKKMENLNF